MTCSVIRITYSFIFDCPSEFSHCVHIMHRVPNFLCCRVRGVSRLRVMDGSIMPLVVTANPMATIYMIGEKGADIVKEDWGYI